VLPFGYTLGSFENLNKETWYFLEVLADKGFGYERLASQRIKTLPRDGGAITAVRPLSAIDNYLPFEVDVVYYNSQGTYTSFVLEYAPIYEEVFSGESSYSQEAQPPVYTSIPLMESPSTIVIEDIPSFDSKVLFRLIGNRTNAIADILDEVEVPLPFQLEAYAYVKQVSTRSVSVYAYRDFRLPEAIYTVDLLRGEWTVDTKKMPLPDPDAEQYETQPTVTFSGLLPDTEYGLRFNADYVNPQTLRTETSVFSEEVVTTLGTYTYEFSHTEDETTIEATITLIDPSHNFQQFFYEIYEEGAFYPYLNGQNGFLSPMDKTSTLVIPKPDYDSYRVVFGVRNEANYYEYDVIDTIDY
jgi:hypothetical protein